MAWYYNFKEVIRQIRKSNPQSGEVNPLYQMKKVGSVLLRNGLAIKTSWVSIARNDEILGDMAAFPDNEIGNILV